VPKFVAPITNTGESSPAVFNVKQYAAKGDDSTNDSPYIQAALDAAFNAGGGQVIVPKGIYRHMDPPFKIRSNVRLTLLPGAEIHRYNDTGGVSMAWNGDSGQNRAGYTGHGNIVIEGGVWDLRCSTSTVSLATDTFTRSNTSAPHTLGVMDTGQTWIDESMRDDGTSTAGCLGITSNTVSAAAAGTNISTVKSWPNGTLSCTIPTVGNAGLVFRLADGQNYWQYVRHTDGNARLSYWVRGVETVVAPTATQAVSAGNTLTVVFFGNRIRAYVGTTLTHDTADLAGFTANRKVGLVVFDTTARLDNFSSSASIWADSFTRSNSSTSLGTTSSNYPWTSRSGTLGINTNLAYAPGAGTNISTVDVIQDCNPTVTMSTAGNAGLVFRYVDSSNYWYFVRHTDGNARLGKVVAGVDTAMTPTATQAVASGNVLQVQVMGKEIRGYVGTTLTHDFTDAFNYQATKAGIIVKDTTARLGAFDTPMSWGTASSGGAFSFGHGHSITFRDVEVRDVSQNQHCVEINACRKVLFDNCRFAGTVQYNARHSECIQLDLAKDSGVFGSFGPYDDTPCKDITVRSCSFVQSYMPGTTAWNRAIGSHNGTIGTTTAHDSIRFTGNYVETIEKGVRGYSWNNSIISDNHFVGGWGVEVRPIWTDTGTTTNTLTRTGVQTGATQDIWNLTITGNTFEMATGTTGGVAAIRVFGESTGLVNNPTITGNVIRNAPEYGISLSYVQGGSVHGNTIVDAAGRGIDIAVGASYNVFSGNNIRRAGDRAFYVSGGAAQNQIVGNFVKGARGTSGTNAAIAISGAAGNTGNVVMANTICTEGSGTEAAQAFKQEGSNATGNVFLGNMIHGFSSTVASAISISGTVVQAFESSTQSNLSQST
jgi:hypothetical protein